MAIQIPEIAGIATPKGIYRWLHSERRRPRALSVVVRDREALKTFAFKCNSRISGELSAGVEGKANTTTLEEGDAFIVPGSPPAEASKKDGLAAKSYVPRVTIVSLCSMEEG
jgi:hypothetical protein